MLYAAIGHSEDVDTESALEEVLEQCRESIAGREPTAGLLFAGIDSEHQELLDGIHAAWPGIQLIGCTTDGEISSRLGFQEDSVTLMVFGSDGVEITAGVGRQLSRDITAACRQAVLEARSKTKLAPALCITTPESMTASGHQVLTELKAAIGTDVPIVGATAGDQFRFEKTVQYCGTEVLSDALPLLLFSGPLVYAFGVASGWKPIGEPGCVTRSEGATVYEIDNAPAMEFYRKYLGADAKPSGECPLAVLDENGCIQYLRAPVGVSIDATAEISYFGNVPQGETVQITVADREAILDGCRESVEKARQNYPVGKQPEAAVFFSCAARKMLLGTRAGEEYEIIQSTVRESIPMCGFYGYGEIGPTKSGSSDSSFHNETFISLLLGT